MTRDERTPFEDAATGFLEFLATQDWPTRVLWLSRDRISGTRDLCWLFRPHELTGDEFSRAFYEAARRTPSSIRIDGLLKIEGWTLAYVHRWGRDSRYLNYGVHVHPPSFRIVRSAAAWQVRCILNRIRGRTSVLDSTAIPPTA